MPTNKHHHLHLHQLPGTYLYSAFVFCIAARFFTTADADTEGSEPVVPLSDAAPEGSVPLDNQLPLPLADGGTAPLPVPALDQPPGVRGAAPLPDAALTKQQPSSH